MTIYFDMDGTIANLYGVENWLDFLINKNATPYKVANTIGNIETICTLLKAIQEKNIKVGVISWLAKNSDREYDQKVRNAKYSWLKKNMQIEFDEIHIVKYGTPKQKYCETENDILFDDEIANRENWSGKAYTPQEIIEVLKALV